MRYFRRNKMEKEKLLEGFPDGDELKPWVSRLRAVTCCTETAFRVLYLVSLCQIAAYLKTTGKPHPVRGLLEVQLQLSISALKLRQGLLLPRGQSIETIAKEEQRWTYAVFTAALLHDCLSTISVDKLLPALGLEFLKSDHTLYLAWFDCLSAKATPQNQIFQIIKSAREKLGTIATNQPFLKGASIKENFIQYIVTHLGSSIFRIHEGLFVHESHLESQAITKKILLAMLKPDLVCKEEECMHILYSKRFEDQRKLHGIIVQLESLPDSVITQPLNQQFHTTRI